MKDKADEERRRLATLPLVEAYEALSEGGGRTVLQQAREFVFGAIMVACNPKYRDLVRTPGGDDDTGELDGNLVLESGVGALWAVLMLGNVDCDTADEMLQIAVQNAHLEHHEKVDRVRSRLRRDPSQN